LRALSARPRDVPMLTWCLPLAGIHELSVVAIVVAVTTQNNCSSCFKSRLRVRSVVLTSASRIWKEHRSAATGPPEYRSGTLMLVRTILTQKFASTLMQSGQSRPILRGHPDDYPDKNAAPGSLMVPHVMSSWRDS